MTTVNDLGNALSGTTGTGTFVGSNTPTITTPVIGQINDSNGNEMLGMTASASAVNHVSIQNTATGVAPTVFAQGSDTNILLSLRGQGNSGVSIQGTTAAGNAQTGFVGEVISSTVTAASPNSYTGGSAANITSIALTAGDWDVWANAAAIGTTVTSFQCGISTTTGTMPANELTTFINAADASGAKSFPAPYQRINVSTTTNVFIVINASGTGTMHSYGFITGRRVR